MWVNWHLGTEHAGLILHSAKSRPDTFRLPYPLLTLNSSLFFLLLCLVLIMRWITTPLCTSTLPQASKTQWLPYLSEAYIDIFHSSLPIPSCRNTTDIMQANYIHAGLEARETKQSLSRNPSAIDQRLRCDYRLDFGDNGRCCSIPKDGRPQ